MSEISRELREQQDKNVGEAFKKIFGDIPTIDAKEIERQEREAIERLNKQLDELKK